MTILKIEQATLSKSGKSYNVKVGDKWYLAKTDSNITTAVGKTIEAEVSESEYNGKTMYWINEWALVAGQAAAAPPAVSYGAPWWMPFVSNTVAHAISAGLIKTPEDIKAWAAAAADTAITVDSDSKAF